MPESLIFKARASSLRERATLIFSTLFSPDWRHTWGTLSRRRRRQATGLRRSRGRRTRAAGVAMVVRRQAPSRVAARVSTSRTRRAGQSSSGRRGTRKTSRRIWEVKYFTEARSFRKYCCCCVFSIPFRLKRNQKDILNRVFQNDANLSKI